VRRTVHRGAVDDRVRLLPFLRRARSLSAHRAEPIPYADAGFDTVHVSRIGPDQWRGGHQPSTRCLKRSRMSCAVARHGWFVRPYLRIESGW
jgi:hypothetical protein